LRTLAVLAAVLTSAVSPGPQVDVVN